MPRRIKIKALIIKLVEKLGSVSKVSNLTDIPELKFCTIESV